MYVRQIRDKVNRIRGQLLLFRPAALPVEVKRVAAVDRWSRGLGILAICMFLAMLLAFGAFWFNLGAGISPLG